MKPLKLLGIIAISTFFACTGTKKMTDNVEKINLPEMTVGVERDKGPYRASRKRVNDLVHTKLNVSFDYSKQHLLGKAWITLKPHFYPTNTLELDAKGFDIHKVEINEMFGFAAAKYEYDGAKLTIELGKTYKKGEQYVIHIDYTAKPNELAVGGSAAITSDKGLYFIDPLDEDPKKPTQIWTQGETESSSCWFPTIDAPNQKTTQELYITVENKYVTLSNGEMKSSVKNNDGTRTDYWHMEKPHTPYLFMMGIGEFSIVKDSWRGKEVNYYVEKKYEPYAKEIFGLTPEMMEFFSNKLGVDYPWNKYNQIVVRDYVSGAMENTTAVIYGEYAQQTSRELLDGSASETTIAHELFHHWFGDLVTCESWSNLPLNESFADYSQTLWMEYKYGQDEGDHENYDGMQGYLNESRSKKENLIRFHYDDKEDMFDGHSYNKGGRILNMLRNYVGDEAFYSALKDYLNDNAYSTGEVHQLRLAFEKTTGEDLNWFFNQWFLSSGHPVLDIQYMYNDSTKEVKVMVEQTQDLESTPTFILPVAIDIYNGAKATRHQVMVESAKDTFSFKVAQKPLFVNFDGDKVLLCQKTENKTTDEFASQMKYAPKYMDRLEAVQHFAKAQDSSKVAQEMLMAATNDKFWAVRRAAVKGMNVENLEGEMANTVGAKLLSLAKTDKKTRVQSDAITKLSEMKDASSYEAEITAMTKVQSYRVASNSLRAIGQINPEVGYKMAKSFSAEENGSFVRAVSEIYAENGTKEDLEFYNNQLSNVSGFTKYLMLGDFGKYLGKMDETTINKALPNLKNIALNDDTWWVRLSARNAIKSVKESFEEKISSFTAGSPEHTRAVTNKERTEAMMNEIKLKETHPRLKVMYAK